MKRSDGETTKQEPKFDHQNEFDHRFSESAAFRGLDVRFGCKLWIAIGALLHLLKIYRHRFAGGKAFVWRMEITNFQLESLISRIDDRLWVTSRMCVLHRMKFAMWSPQCELYIKFNNLESCSAQKLNDKDSLSEHDPLSIAVSSLRWHSCEVS